MKAFNAAIALCIGLAAMPAAAETEHDAVCSHVRAYEHDTRADIEVYPIGGSKIVCPGSDHAESPRTFVTTDVRWWVENSPRPGNN